MKVILRLGLLASTLLVACGGVEAPSTVAPDPSVNPPSADCTDAPTWTSFGQGFLMSRCQSCHASGAPRRYGAPASVAFDTESEAMVLADRIRARTLSDPPTMPPSGGLSVEDRGRLDRWLRCAQP